jgi:hypothetical protein
MDKKLFLVEMHHMKFRQSITPSLRAEAKEVRWSETIPQYKVSSTHKDWDCLPVRQTGFAPSHKPARPLAMNCVNFKVFD